MTEPCIVGREWVVSYVYGDMPDDARRAADEHLAACPRCTAVVRELEAVRRAADGYEVPAPPADIDGPILAAAREQAARRSRRGWWAHPAVAAGAVAAGVLLVFWVVRPRTDWTGKYPTSVPSESAPSADGADQGEARRAAADVGGHPGPGADSGPRAPAAPVESGAQRLAEVQTGGAGPKRRAAARTGAARRARPRVGDAPARGQGAGSGAEVRGADGPSPGEGEGRQRSALAFATPPVRQEAVKAKKRPPSPSAELSAEAEAGLGAAREPEADASASGALSSAPSGPVLGGPGGDGEERAAWNKAHAALRSGRCALALPLLRRLITHYPRSATASRYRFEAARCAATLGLRDDAVRWYRSLVNDPEYGARARAALAALTASP